MDHQFIKEKYNTDIQRESRGEYEKYRWFASPEKKAGYIMTRHMIEKKILPNALDCRRYLELGPGPGTWTALFIEKNVAAAYDLVDISKEMLAQAKRQLSRFDTVSINYIESDFLTYYTKNQYDFFFSSRAIEYITEKQVAIHTLFSLLAPGGCGAIITKAPKYIRAKLFRQHIGSMHQGQIRAVHLKRLLQAEGFCNIIIFPVTMSVPLFRSARLNLYIFWILSRLPLLFWMLPCVESYGVVFRKPGAQVSPV